MSKIDSFAFEMRERIFKYGKLIFDSDFYSPNTMTNAGQADMLNVWARETSPLNKYLMLLNMPAAGAPVKTTVYSGLTESVAPGTASYDRQQIIAADWSTPVLDLGDTQIAAASKSFGPFTGDVPVSHVGLVSTATGTGTFFLYVSILYHTQNNIARAFVAGESYQVTLRDKQI